MATYIPAPEPGWVKLLCDDPFMRLLAILGPDSPKLSMGGGRWEKTDRPRQTQMAEWLGTDLYQLQFSILLDGGRLDSEDTASTLMRAPGNPHQWFSQEPANRTLWAVYGGDRDAGRPGIIRVQGIPDAPSIRWFIEEMEIQDDAIRRTSDFQRIRQVIALTLTEYQPPTFKKLKRYALQGPSGSGKTVVFKVTASANTPAKIAKLKHCKWTDLRKLNPSLVKKANQKLKVGTKVRVPVPKHDAKKK